MHRSSENASSARRHGTDSRAVVLLGSAAVALLLVTFFAALSGLPFALKVAVFAAAVAVNIAITAMSLRQNGSERAAEVPMGCAADVSDIDDKLAALDDANDFFSGSLKPADMFRLVSSRLGEIIPVSASLLFVPDDESGGWRVEFADGRNAAVVKDISLEAGDGLAARAAGDAYVVIEPEVILDIGSLPAEFLAGVRSAAAIPLHDGKGVFAVFQIYSEKRIDDNDDNLLLLEAAAERLEPLFISSAALERSLANAFTDPVTNLPNERAFFMILENQLAESHRYRDDRPVTVLAIDIKGFDDANAAFGHAAGDRILNFVTEGIRGQLRKMDFLSRSVDDEFIVILPAAPEHTAEEVVERIKTYFANNTFEVSDEEAVNIWLNFGSATFWKDGETALQLLQAAQVRKQQAKRDDSGKVIWFPKEYVH